MTDMTAAPIVARGGETLESLIKGTGAVDSIQAGLAAEAVAKTTNSKKLRPGEELRLGLTPSIVDENAIDVGKLSLFYHGAHVVTIVRSADGAYSTSDKPLKSEQNYEESAGEHASVYVSTYRAAKSQDLPEDFITKFLKVHSYDVDFKQRVKSGDGFELFYELVQDENGAERPGELLYAGVTIGGETHGYYRFRTTDGGVDYYDDKGSNSKKFLMRTPVRGATLTSGFGYRVHPLLGTVRAHLGVDWSGPIGTPVMATGNGTIEMADREGNYGNYIRVRHANGYKTVYAHLLRFAAGAAKGVKVHQGQIIGYLGNTGMSTGPHVHYEVLINNQHTDPLSIKIPKSRQLQGRLLTDFRREKARIEDLMHRAPVKTRVATVEKYFGQVRLPERQVRETCGQLGRKVENLSVDDQTIGAGRDFSGIAVLDLSRQDQFRERILDGALDHTLQRPRAIGWIVTAVREPSSRLGIEVERDLAILQELLKPLQLNIDNRAHLFAPQAVEEQDIVDAVQKFGPEMRAHHGHDLVADDVDILAERLRLEILRAEIRRHDDDRVAEIDGAALAVRQAPVIQNLQKHIEDVWMRFLDLVEKHDLIGATANKFRERPAFLITDITGRRADEPGH